MASEFLYILCAGYQVWVAREGGNVSAQQYLSIRSTDIILPSRNQLAQPRLQSQSQLCLTRHDISFKTQETTLETTVLQPPSRIATQHFYHTTPAMSPISRSTPANSSFVPTITLYFILDKLNSVPALRPLQDPPMHNIFQMDTTATCHVEPRYLKQPVPRGTYCNALYSIHSRYIYSPNQHIQITPTG